MHRRREKVLCVCGANISRSPMMQAVLQQTLGPRFRVESAGVTQALAGRPANRRSVICLREPGIDLSDHLSRWIGDLDLGEFSWIVCVGADEAEQVRAALGEGSAAVLIANENEGGIPDPYELGLQISGLPRPVGCGDARGGAAHRGRQRRLSG